MLQQIIHSENNFPTIFSSVHRRGDTDILFNETNPHSYDSNHALIFKYNQIEKTLREIETFYKNINITPRIYQSFTVNEKETLFPVLTKNGFTIEMSENKLLLLKDKSIVKENKELRLHRITEINEDIYQLLLLEDGGDWNIKKIKISLKNPDFYYFGLSNEENSIVSVASIYITENISRIDDVVTHVDFRKNGYGTQLIYKIIKYHTGQSNNHIFLFAENDTALRIYEKNGFRLYDKQIHQWSAQKSLSNCT